MSRVEWLKLAARRGGPARRARHVLFFLTFETYYLLCALLGHRVRHFLDPLPERLRTMPAGRYVVIWLRLPLTLRLLDRLLPYERAVRAEYVPYTAEAEVRASGRRASVVDTAGVFTFEDGR